MPMTIFGSYMTYILCTIFLFDLIATLLREGFRVEGSDRQLVSGFQGFGVLGVC